MYICQRNTFYWREEIIQFV